MSDIKEMSFEAAMAELEKIVTQLERGDAPLEDSITLYERGAALKAHLDATLKAAQMKVDKIMVDSPSDNVTAKPESFD